MIDLHCHSTCSDGTDTPEILAEKGRDFTAFALTDHDNCDGCARFLAAGRKYAGLRLAGVELSVDPGEGYAKFHLLGLGVDPKSARLNVFLDQIRAWRNERNRRIVRRLAELGMPIQEEELLKYANGKIVARPHIARVLMDHGWALGVKDAFSRFLGDGRPAFVPRAHPPQAEAIEVVHAAGGVAVMAHPRYWTQDPEMLRSGLRKLMDLGLDGIEAVYRANLPGETVEHLRIARELGLAVTAGSDFHGANRPDISLGMTTDDDAAFLAPILSRLESRRAGGRVVEVVGGIIRRGDRYLLGRRPEGKAQAGCWEFVGGKIEPGESPEQALVRECLEEIALPIVNLRVRTAVTHAYPDKTVHLMFFDCEPKAGAEPTALEHAALGWFTADEAMKLTFCPADTEVLPVIFGTQTATGQGR